MDIVNIPAFGFQTQEVHADIYEQLAEQKLPEINESSLLMRVKPLKELREDEVLTNIKYDNINKILGYIPIIGIIVGGDRIWRCSKEDENKVKIPNKNYHRVRGVMEILGIASLLFIPDIILTYARQHEARKQELNK